MKFIFTLDELLFLLPGVVALMITKCISGDSININAKKDSVTYICYTFTAMLFVAILDSLELMPNFKHSFALIQILFAIIASFLWNLFLKDMFFNMINFMLEKAGMNKVYYKKSVFEERFKDGKDHYISITKNNRIIASGFLGDFDENEESFSVLSPAEGEKVYLTKVKAVIIYKDKDLTIQEFEWSSQK